MSSRTGTHGIELFAYDAVGNRKTYERKQQGETLVSEAYRYDTQSNRLLEVTRGSEARALGYDAVGNTVRDQGFDGKARVLAYGADNRLKSVDGGVTYWHNAEGQRVIARDDKGLRHFVYDVQDRLVAEAEADGTVVREYFYLDRVPVAMLDVADDRLYFVHGDHLGTPKQVTDAEGNVVWTGEALAFGATRVEGEVRLDFRFPGQVEDGATGYFYNYFRDYDASVGRYLQSDPIGLAAGINTFAYVAGNPVIRVDETGLLWYGAHFSISYSAARDSGYSVGSSLRFAWNVMMVDFGTQGTDPSFTRYHFMIGENSNAVQAHSNAMDLVNNVTGEFSLADRAHALQDSAAPWHVDHGWTASTPFFEKVYHVFKDVFPGSAVKQDAYQKTKKLLGAKCVEMMGAN